jgi:hypothetical protein
LADRAISEELRVETHSCTLFLQKKQNCFYCKLVINEDESIQCLNCKNYFHETCVGISHKKDDYDIDDLDEKDYICIDCLFKKSNK